jgi:hypothetical protein
MFHLLFELLFVALIVGCLVQWRRGIVRRRGESWETLLGKLHPNWNAQVFGKDFLPDATATPEDIWHRIGGAKGLCSLFHNAGVLMEMAGYAVRNDPTPHRALLAAIHKEALRVQVLVVRTLVQYAFLSLSEGVRENAFWSVSIYIGMTVRMTQLLQESSANLLPGFVEAM